MPSRSCKAFPLMAFALALGLGCGGSYGGPSVGSSGDAVPGYFYIYPGDMTVPTGGIAGFGAAYTYSVTPPTLSWERSDDGGARVRSRLCVE